MHYMKLPGQRLMARDIDRQVAEFQVRAAVLNGFTALGIPVTNVVGYVCPGEGAVRPSADLCKRAPYRPKDHIVDRRIDRNRWCSTARPAWAIR